jgi:hypothetical protein
MHGLKILSSTTALLVALALVPVAKSQVAINIGVQPVCSYGYYDYSPYACAPVGFYGPGYFYNGIFLGMGPWSGWGYSHGWGGHRFSSGGGGRYNGGGGAAANRGRHEGSTTVIVHANNAGSHAGVNTGGAHAAAAGGSTSHASQGTPHTAAAHGGAPMPPRRIVADLTLAVNPMAEAGTDNG